MRHDEPLERSIDVIKMDVRQKTVDAGVDAIGLVGKQEPVRPDQIYQHLEIRKASSIDLLGLIAADALKIVSFKIIFSRRFQIAGRQPGMRREELVPEKRPESIVAPA